jgi:8-oxo-dGTP diphosphatase
LLRAVTTVVAALIERQGLILICQRKRGQAHELKWEFPGGKVEAGEVPSDALRRELREELAIDASIGDEITRYQFAYPGRAPILLIFFRVSEFAGVPQNLVFEKTEWVEKGRLPEFDFLEGDVDFVRSDFVQASR